MKSKMKTITEFPENILELIRVQYGVFKENQCFSIRRYFKNDLRGWKPGKRCIAINIDKLPQLGEASNKILLKIEKEIPLPELEPEVIPEPEPESIPEPDPEPLVVPEPEPVPD